MVGVKFPENSFVQKGTWVYYFENATLTKTEKWRKMTRKEHRNYKHARHTRDQETGF